MINKSYNPGNFYLCRALAKSIRYC